ncbi:hypothetical protein KP509_05G065100 [Ceratopteris richardii]|nr:hypothetical protein KP509_05G065100 [Ceratopteris richardii]KAH7437299.1 hypothetical protein KP509_05G065100 [Ceratopteris richardii]KAH7437300.1 hypothetical protein KP509_05G065100 [Ceratopteris richardii]KAH7437301.1 hypothetical protein KP509_05G065100 [Ceratopteris richardii]
MASGHSIHATHAATRWMHSRSLGCGSFGHVSLARNIDDGSLFAVKSTAGSSPVELLALRNEFRILQSLCSPFVIRCLGSEFLDEASSRAEGTSGYLFLEYIDGGSLADMLTQSGERMRSEEHVRQFTRSISKGLAYLHENGVVHCDIKSKNILVGSCGDVKIADFGAARRIGEEAVMEGTRVRGTPHWMAPEVAMGEAPTPASDIWSLGCTVVEMLQGTPPWGRCASSVAAALFKLGCTDEIPPLPKSISSDAQDFLLKCLRREPKERWRAEQLLSHPFIRDGNKCNGEISQASNRSLEGEECDRLGDHLPTSLPDLFKFSHGERLHAPPPRSMRDRFVLRRCDSDGEQISPRSTLDHFMLSDSESENEKEEKESLSAGMPTMAVIPTATPQHASIPERGQWIVVRQVHGWLGQTQRERPFMQTLSGCKVIAKGCCVSLTTAEFLRSRAKLYMQGR